MTYNRSMVKRMDEILPHALNLEIPDFMASKS
jgi:phage tail protein X